MTIEDQIPTETKTIEEEPQDYATSTKVAITTAMLVFAASLLAIFLVYKTFPEVTEEERQHFKLPRNVEEAKRLGMVLNRYKDDNYLQVMAAVFATYIFLHAFGIPGHIFVSLLSGFLFPLAVALVMACSGAALGASLCFLFSYVWGRKLLSKYCPERARYWTAKVDEHRDNLFNYMLFLRIIPLIPGLFINVASPVVGVPWLPFAMGIFIGIVPRSLLCIQGGRTLQNLAAGDAALSATTCVTLLAGCAVVSLLPIVLKKWLKKRIQ